MLKALQIFGSSSSSGYFSLSNRLKKPQASFSLISRKPTKAIIAEFANTYSLPFQFRKGRAFRAFRMSHTHSESNPDGVSSSSPSASIAVKSMSTINFCQLCGGPTKHEIPDGEEKIRAICTHCGRIAYENPKMVVSCLIEHENKILLCKRNIQPSFGLWTLPAGYMEIGESAAEGAIREIPKTLHKPPLSLIDLPQVYIIFLAKLKRPHFSPGPESSECELFVPEDIPFDSLAFSSMLVTLKLYIEDRKVGRPMFHYGIINKRCDFVKPFYSLICTTKAKAYILKFDCIAHILKVYFLFDCVFMPILLITYEILKTTSIGLKFKFFCTSCFL